MSDTEFDELCASIDPSQPCPGAPGSDLKMAYLCARYHSDNHRLWNPRDASLAGVQPMMSGFVIEEDEEDEEGDEW